MNLWAHGTDIALRITTWFRSRSSRTQKPTWLTAKLVQAMLAAEEIRGPLMLVLPRRRGGGYLHATDRVYGLRFVLAEQRKITSHVVPG